MTDVSPVFELAGISKAYGGLRPLRVRSLVVRQGAIVALTGLDAPAAEMLVNLLTGATLPETGEVRVLGRPTSAITDADEWLASIDRCSAKRFRPLADGTRCARGISLPSARHSPCQSKA